MLRSHTTQSYRLKIGSAILSCKGIYWGRCRADERLENQFLENWWEQGDPKETARITEKVTEQELSGLHANTTSARKCQENADDPRVLSLLLPDCGKRREKYIHSPYHAPSYPVSAQESLIRCGTANKADSGPSSKECLIDSIIQRAATPHQGELSWNDTQKYPRIKKKKKKKKISSTE